MNTAFISLQARLPKLTSLTVECPSDDWLSTMAAVDKLPCVLRSEHMRSLRSFALRGLFQVAENMPGQGVPLLQPQEEYTTGLTNVELSMLDEGELAMLSHMPNLVSCHRPS